MQIFSSTAMKPYNWFEAMLSIYNSELNGEILFRLITKKQSQRLRGKIFIFVGTTFGATTDMKEHKEHYIRVKLYLYRIKTHLVSLKDQNPVSR